MRTHDDASLLGGEVIILRGDSPEGIFQGLDALKEQARSAGSLAGLAYERNRSASGSHVLAVAAEDPAKLLDKIALVEKTGAAAWEKPPRTFAMKGIHIGKRPERRPKVAFLFPGQGAQYVDMLKDLSAKYQVVAETFEEADEALKDVLGGKLSDRIFNRGEAAPERIQSMEEALKQTEITQPAVLAADIAVWRLLKLLGIEPETAIGHSLGEYGALVAAGVLEPADAVRTVRRRAECMKSVNAGDNGKMASVAAPVDKVEPVLREVDGYVVAVNKNGPSQTVIAGASAAVDAAVKLFGERKMKAVPVAVSHAFHSKIVAPATKPFGEYVAGLPVRAPRFPVLSNATAEPYPGDESGIRELMVRQIESPVEFIRQLERMYADGARVFVEAGPKRILGSLAASTLADKTDIVVASANHPKKGGIQEFNELLGRLVAAGVDPDFSKTDPSSEGSLHAASFRERAAR